jgi:hypothetical protein
MSDMPKFPLIVRNDEVGYISQHDDQSYGMFCPVAIVRDAKFAAMCASAPDLLEALEVIKKSMHELRNAKAEHMKIGMDMIASLADEAIAKAKNGEQQ